MYYDHSTCMYYDHSVSIMFYRAHVQRNSRLGSGAEASWKAGGFGGPPGALMSDGRNHFHPGPHPLPSLLLQYKKGIYGSPLEYNVYSARWLAETWCGDDPHISDHQLGLMFHIQSTRQTSTPRGSDWKLRGVIGELYGVIDHCELHTIQLRS